MDTDHHVIPPLAPAGGLVMGERELIAWGEQLGRFAHPPLVIALSGELGAGKTTLARAICVGYGVTEPVTSPTYALVHEYHAPRSAVIHVDLYRIERPDDLGGIGWDELVGSHALVIVEWPEHALDRLPADHLPIALDYLPSEPSRRLLLAG